MRISILVGLLITLCNSIALAQNTPPAPTTITLGNFTEQGTKRFDYHMEYSVLETPVAGQPLRLQVDVFDNPVGLRRLWVNYGQITLVNDKSFSATFSPGLILTNHGRYFFGGTLAADYKPLGLSVIYKGAAGNKKDRHLIFTTVNLTKEFGIQHYFYSERGWSADSYIGSVYSKGSVYLWAGKSLNRPGAWAVNVQATIKF